ncbi:MAG: hypothetical protein LBK59_06790, partial [Bifidobacteriaceae bacterium]|nr:hypothetical protein [Bifidobacteriaceae bacterium]
MAWSRSGAYLPVARLVDVTELSAQKVLTNVSSKNPYAKARPTLKSGVRVVKRVSYGLEGAGIWVLSNGTIQVDKRLPRECRKDRYARNFPQAPLPAGQTYVDVESKMYACEVPVLTAEGPFGSLSGGGPPPGLTFTRFVDGAGVAALFLSDGRVYLSGVCQPGARGGEPCIGRTMISPNRVSQGIATGMSEIALLGEDGT